MMVAALRAAEGGRRFDHRRAAELTSPDDERVVQHPPLFEIAHQGGRRLIGLGRLRTHATLDVAVMIPTGMIHLNEPHAALGQSSGEEAVVGEVFFGSARSAPYMSSVPGVSCEKSISSGARDCMRKAIS